jgi:hypothetical protein
VWAVEQCLETVCRGRHLVRVGMDQSAEEIRVVVAIDMTSATLVPDLVSAFYPLGTQVKSPLALVFLISPHLRAYTMYRIELCWEFLNKVATDTLNVIQ